MKSKKLPPRFQNWEPTVGRFAEGGPDAFVLEVDLEGATIRQRFTLDPETAQLAPRFRPGDRVRVLAEPLAHRDARNSRVVRWVESAGGEWSPERPPRPRRPRPSPGQLGMFGGEVRP